MTPTLSSWAWFVGTLAGETALIIGLAAGACRFLAHAQRQRACWQAALIALVLVTLMELGGLRAWVWARYANPNSQRRLVVSFVDPSTDAAQWGNAPPGASGHGLDSGKKAPVTWPGWLWISGTFLLALAGGATRFWLLVERRKMPSAELETWSMAEPLFAPLRLSKAAICTWSRAHGPVAFGFWRLTVALPLDFAQRFTSQQRTVMLAHELAHLAARDPFWFALADAFCAVVWWHPLAWWMRRQFRRACESAADEASALAPGGPTTLAESLVAFGRELNLSAPFGGLGVAGSGFQSELGLRVKALLEKSPKWQELPSSWRWGPQLLAIFCAGITVALPLKAANPGWMWAGTAKTETTPTPLKNTPGASSIPMTNIVNPPGQELALRAIALQIQFVETPKNSAAETELDAWFGNHLTEASMESGPAPDLFPDAKLPSQRHVVADRATTRGHAAILDNQQFSILETSLKRQKGLDWLAAPRVETLTGREARVSTQDPINIVFDADTTNGTRAHPTASINYDVASVLLGPTADIIPRAADGGWDLDVSAKFVEFVGYDKSEEQSPSAESWVDPTLPRSEKIQGTRPLPHFRLRQTQASAFLRSGQTMALRGPLAFPQPGAITGATNRWYVFVSVGPAQD